MVTADIAENNLIELLKEFEIFEWNRISLEIKLTAIAMYLLSSSLRRIALLLNVALLKDRTFSSLSHNFGIYCNSVFLSLNLN